jgi:coenzyme F420-0:L-glutamate ligase/coenzyme F420-1:gamma-L-glutamate ligase
MTVELIPLEGLPEVEPGDDLAGLLEPSLAAKAASDGDVVAITQKVVSKAEGRLVSGLDRTEWVERESVDFVARRGDLVITRTRHGLVCANAGVDASNVREGFLTLLPEDPDASAEQLQKELSSRLGLSRLGVVITDTFGRPWREGLVDVAIGCAGFPSLVDLRGRADDHGKQLEATVVALADAVAAAGGLVMTKTARVPAALVRGLGAAAEAPPGPARDLIRGSEDDLFRESALLSLSASRPSGSFAPGPVPREALEEAVRAACAVPSPAEPLFVTLESRPAIRRLLGAARASGRAELVAASVLVVACRRAHGQEHEEALLLEAGGAIQNLVLALHAQHLAWWWDPSMAFDREGVRIALQLDEAWRPMGIVGAGRMPEGGAPVPRPLPDPPDVLDRRG